jgi:hypothetical protein
MTHLPKSFPIRLGAALAESYAKSFDPLTETRRKL